MRRWADGTNAWEYNGRTVADGVDREMQLFLLGFIIIEICEIFTVGGFPLNDAVRKVRVVWTRQSLR